MDAMCSCAGLGRTPQTLPQVLAGHRPYAALQTPAAEFGFRSALRRAGLQLKGAWQAKFRHGGKSLLRHEHRGLEALGKLAKQGFFAQLVDHHEGNARPLRDQALGDCLGHLFPGGMPELGMAKRVVQEDPRQLAPRPRQERQHAEVGVVLVQAEVAGVEQRAEESGEDEHHRSRHVVCVHETHLEAQVPCQHNAVHRPDLQLMEVARQAGPSQSQQPCGDLGGVDWTPAPAVGETDQVILMGVAAEEGDTWLIVVEGVDGDGRFIQQHRREAPV
mmetsp:Transcript_36377/g.83929  ORF Transcript_36377/g.83929 Transcript_36377/m.83929 type:complete len:275 (-) Transcript_36377:7-831(-)